MTIKHRAIYQGGRLVGFLWIVSDGAIEIAAVADLATAERLASAARCGS
ncbi:MAG: hypothetical protein ACREEN_00360 [Stellaceae bacterium]